MLSIIACFSPKMSTYVNRKLKNNLKLCRQFIIFELMINGNIIPNTRKVNHLTQII